jgi:hypothetical protein
MSTTAPASSEDRTSSDYLTVALDALSAIAKSGSTQEIRVEAAKTILQYYR